jgi:hypothetical protein
VRSSLPMTVKAGGVIVVCVCVMCMDGMKGVRLEREGRVVGWVKKYKNEKRRKLKMKEKVSKRGKNISVRGK